MAPLVESQEGGSKMAEHRRGGTCVYKIVVLGEGGVGKSALTLQFVSHCFLEHHDPTIEDAYQQQAVIDGEPALLDILDTAGQMEFTAMRDQYMRCGEGFIICYSTCDRRSFEEVSGYTAVIEKVRARHSCPVVLVGNKVDLAGQRMVSTEEGLALAQSCGWPFFETSAALRHCVDDVFHTIVRAIRCRQKNQELPPCGILAPSPVGGLRGALKRTGRGTKPSSRWKRFKNAFLWIFRRNRYK
ncbi:Small GTP-binding protein domain [Trinorchestia longiramus]|nr:Small GTP-binding protein domain [Trinorchestia longiramus]